MLSDASFRKTTKCSHYQVFLEKKQREIPQFPIQRLSSNQLLTKEVIRSTGLSRPFVVIDTKSTRLGIKLPESDKDLTYVSDVVGPQTPIKIIEVGQQNEISDCTLGNYAEYLKYRTVDHKVLNMITLEFSATALDAKVRAPKFVREIDWIDSIWPLDRRARGDYPKVQKYCLAGMGGSYTDFHIDFGGTSVWYHVLSGQKTFYLVPPTTANLRAFVQWTCSSTQSDTFFGDFLPPGQCYQFSLNPQETFMIPSGWIHAVYTPIDSLVFGGNFVHSYAILRQLQVFSVEKRTRVQKAYRFPFFKQINWYFLCSLLCMAERKYLRTDAKTAVTGGGTSIDDDNEDEDLMKLCVMLREPNVFLQLPYLVKTCELWHQTCTDPKERRIFDDASAAAVTGMSGGGAAVESTRNPCDILISRWWNILAAIAKQQQQQEHQVQQPPVPPASVSASATTIPTTTSTTTSTTTTSTAAAAAAALAHVSYVRGMDQLDVLDDAVVRAAVAESELDLVALFAEAGMQYDVQHYDQRRNNKTTPAVTEGVMLGAKGGEAGSDAVESGATAENQNKSQNGDKGEDGGKVGTQEPVLKLKLTIRRQPQQQQQQQQQLQSEGEEGRRERQKQALLTALDLSSSSDDNDDDDDDDDDDGGGGGGGGEVPKVLSSDIPSNNSNNNSNNNTTTTSRGSSSSSSCAYSRYGTRRKKLSAAYLRHAMDVDIADDDDAIEPVEDAGRIDTRQGASTSSSNSSSSTATAITNNTTTTSSSSTRNNDFPSRNSIALFEEKESGRRVKTAAGSGGRSVGGAWGEEYEEEEEDDDDDADDDADADDEDYEEEPGASGLGTKRKLPSRVVPTVAATSLSSVAVEAAKRRAQKGSKQKQSTQSKARLSRPAYIVDRVSQTSINTWNSTGNNNNAPSNNNNNNNNNTGVGGVVYAAAGTAVKKRSGISRVELMKRLGMKF